MFVSYFWKRILYLLIVKVRFWELFTKQFIAEHTWKYFLYTSKLIMNKVFL